MGRMNGSIRSELTIEALLLDEEVSEIMGNSFATDLLDRTGNIVLVGKILGHRSVITTQRYLHPEIKGIAEIVNERNAIRAANEGAQKWSMS